MPDRTKLAGDGYDAQPVTSRSSTHKAASFPQPTSVTFALDGQGAIIGLNNGDPTNHEPEKGTRHSTYTASLRSSCKPR